MKKRHILAILLIGVIFFFPLDLFSNLSYLKQKPITGKSIFSELFSPLRCSYKIEIKNKLNQNIGSYTKNNCNFNLIYNNNKVEINNLKSNIKAYIDKTKDPKFNSNNAIFIENALLDQATITLEKKGPIFNIYKCSNNNFNLKEFSCKNWEKTNIPFTQTDNTVTFTVNSFSTYIPGTAIPISVSASSALEQGPLPELWYPGIDIGGLGGVGSGTNLASLQTLNMWDQEIGFNRGLHHVFIRHWTFRNNGATLENYGSYTASIKERGGTPLVRLVGTPCALSDNCNGNYYAYAPNDLTVWQDMIYDELKYLVVGTDESGNPQKVNNYILFNDNEDHTALGLGDDILFSFWYDVWQTNDDFPFQGTQEEYLQTWNATYEAAKRLEQDYNVDIKLGGFGFGDIQAQQGSVWGVGGLIYNLTNFSHDPNRDGNDDDRIPIEWIDYQFRHPDPFAISNPTGWTDFTEDLQDYLREFGYQYDDNDVGYEPGETLIMANEWHGQGRVMGLSGAFGGLPFGCCIETMSEIDAALNPTRIYDMGLAGQEKQVREYIQDYYAGSDNPFFREGAGGGGNGIITLGLPSEGYLGLKKATFNSFKLIDMLGDIKLWSDSVGEHFFDYDYTVNAYATKNSTDSSIRILVWTYVSPYRNVSLTDSGLGEGEDDECYDDSDTRVCYNDLYAFIEEDIGNESFYIDLSINDLNFNTDNIKVERYLIDKYHSNAFEYRYQVCWAINLTELNEDRGICGITYNPNITDPNLPQDPYYTIEQINQWTFNNNPYVNDPINNPPYYNISIDIEKVEDYTIQDTDTFNKELSLLPYSTTLLILTPEETTSSCGNSICESDESCSSCSIDCGDCPPPGNGPPGGGGGGGSGGSGSDDEDTEEDQENQTLEQRFDINLFENTEYRILSSIETLLITTDNIHEHLFIINNIYEDNILFSLDDLQSSLYLNESRLFTLDNIDIQVFLDSITNGNAILTFKRVSELPLRTLIKGRVWPYIDIIIGLAFLISILVLIKSYKEKYRSV